MVGIQGSRGQSPAVGAIPVGSRVWAAALRGLRARLCWFLPHPGAPAAHAHGLSLGGCRQPECQLARLWREVRSGSEPGSPSLPGVSRLLGSVPWSEGCWVDSGWSHALLPAKLGPHSLWGRLDVRVSQTAPPVWACFRPSLTGTTSGL